SCNPSMRHREPRGTSMKTSKRAQAKGYPAFLRRVMPVAVAFSATLLALPLRAVTVPDLPLQTGAAYPPPNIMFVLDDSGSMSFQTMPDDNYASGLRDGIQDYSYTHNTIFYNPATTYL